jgi:hypothetical protein
MRLDYMRDPENWVSPYATEQAAEPQTELGLLRKRVAALEARNEELEAIIRGEPAAVSPGVDTDTYVRTDTTESRDPIMTEEERRRPAAPRTYVDDAAVDAERIRAEEEAAATGAAPRSTVTEDETVTVRGDDRDLSWRDKMANRWYGMNAKIGGFVLGRKLGPRAGGGYYIYDRQGRPIRQINDDEYEVIEEENERSGRRVVIIGVAIAVGALILGALLYKYGHRHPNGINNHLDEDVIRNGRIPTDQYNQIIDQINDNQADLTAQEARDHTLEMDRLNEIAEEVQEDTQIDRSNHRLLEHINRHLHNLRGVRFEGIDLTSFNTDTFYGRTPREAINDALDVIRDNNIQVHGVTSDKIEAIKDDMMQRHWHIASGMESASQQHIVDVANDWQDGLTSNANASAAQGFKRDTNGSSMNGWHNFMVLASRHGIKFSGNAT